MTLPQAGAGRRLASVGNYRFTGRRLGKGNFAKVEEAAHTLLNVKVAIKIMDVSTIKEDYVVRNLYREAKIMSKLSHPCIAALFQTMQHGNMYYIVTELVNGGDLCTFIKGQRNGRLEEGYTRVYARQLISAISHMHNLGIVHRDLKMENVMLSLTNNRVKIVDFGLSNVYDVEAGLRTHCGSPEYAAPELFVEGKHYGPEVDLWSFGVILYGMVVGQLPFVSTSKDGAVTSHQQRRKRLLEQINKGLSTSHRRALALFSAEFKAMMAKLLVADSSKRINIVELVYHPWVTEKGRKLIRTNPMKRIDENTQINVSKDVAALTSADLNDVQHSIKTDPFGNISGMYKLILHQHSQAMLESDPIAKNPHQYVPSRPRSSDLHLDLVTKQQVALKRQNLLKSAPIQRQQKITQVVKSNEQQAKTRSKRPATVKETAFNFVPLRKHVQPVRFTPPAEGVKERASSTSAASRKIASPKYSTAYRSPAGGDSICKTPNCDKHGHWAQMKTKKTKIEEITPTRSMRTHSASVTLEETPAALKSPNVGQAAAAARRPLTTIPTHTAERAAKRRSMLPVLTAKRETRVFSAAAATTTPASGAAPVTPKTHKSMLEKRQDYIEECRKIISPVQCFSSNRIRNFNNEPIARSIAGYVRKNISSRLEPLKWAKGAKLNIGT